VRPLRSLSSLAAVLLLGACSAGGADPASLRRGLERAGLSASAAECVVDGLRADLAPAVLDSRSDPSAADRAAVDRVL